MRKAREITISEDGRDKGKSFLITEMAATEADDWAMKALFLLARSGAEIPNNLMGGGMASFAAVAGLGIQALLYVPYESAKPLLDRLMTCVQIREAAVTRSLTMDDIEEIGTFSTLRGEALKLHIGFFLSASPSTSSSTGGSSSSSTPTSAPPLAQ